MVELLSNEERELLGHRMNDGAEQWETARCSVVSRTCPGRNVRDLSCERTRAVP